MEKTAGYDIEQVLFNGGKKDGTLTRGNDSSERSIKWEIYVNALSQDLMGSDFGITDTLSDGQVFDQASLVVKQYSLDKDGSIEVGKIVGSEYYSVDWSGTNDEFTLTFGGGIKDPYMVEVKSEITGLSEAEYENTATINAKGGYNKEYEKTVNYKKHNSFLIKDMADIKSVYTDDELKWKLTINESLSDIDDGAVLTDTISDGLIYLNNSLKIKKLNGDLLIEGDDKDYQLKVDRKDDGTTILKITFNAGITTKYTVEYSTVVVAGNGIEISNQADFTGYKTDATQGSNKKITVTQWSGGSGSGDRPQGTGAITVIKHDAEDDNKKLVGAGFKLWYLINDIPQYVGGAEAVHKTDNSGKLEFTALSFRTYFLQEVEAPTGYVNSNGEYDVYELELKSGTEETTQEVPNHRPRIDVTVKKDWDGGPTPRPDITLKLYRNNNFLYSAVLKDGATEHIWENLYKTDIDGNDYVFTVDEEQTPENYEKTVNNSALTVTNKYVSPKISVTGTKLWELGPPIKPAIELQLHRDGEAYLDAVSLDGENDSWQYTWTDLDETDHEGKPYVYTVDEVKQPPGYSKSISKDGLTVTNTYVPPYMSPKTAITGSKKWDGGPSDRPAIKLQLYRDGTALGEPVELANGELSYTWNDIDLTDSARRDYVYTVDEVAVPDGYEKSISADGQTVTNKFIRHLTTVTAKKVWEGGPDAKPTIELQLYRNGEKLGAPVELANGELSHTWNDVDLTDSAGKTYVYTVDEVSVPGGYEKSISADGLTVTNKFIKHVTAVTAKKVWVGGPTAKPAINLQLYRNGEKLGAPVELANGGTTYTWSDLDEKDVEGSNYYYSVDEADVLTDYEKSISADGLTVTNTYKGVKEYAITLNANPSTIVGDGKSESVLTAKVTDENGDPVAGVEVVFDAPRGTFHGDPDNPKDGKNTAVTDADGKARVVYRSEKIEGIESQVIPVTATVEDKEKDLYAKDTIYVTFEPASITGVVTDNTTGLPIEGARVIVTYSGDWEFYSDCTTGPDGAYKIAIPKGETVYNIEIIKPVMVNGQKVDVSFKQKAQVDVVDESKKDEEFPAVETFTGVIITKDKDGQDRIACKQTADKITIKEITADGVSGKTAEVDPNTGVFVIEELAKGRTYEFVMIVEVDGQELIAGKIQVQIDTDGEISIHEELIDPYGTITDGKTGEVLGNVDVELFWADTPRNRAKGRTPHTRVILPGILGFAPSDNDNPQKSSATTVFNNHPDVQDHGNYAFMVFPEGDYYIEGTKDGYHDYTSETISVDYDIVKHDFEMWPIVTGGGSGGSGSSGGSKPEPGPGKPGQPVEPVEDPTEPKEELTESGDPEPSGTPEYSMVFVAR